MSRLPSPDSHNSLSVIPGTLLREPLKLWRPRVTQVDDHPMLPTTIEEALRSIEERAAVLRFLTSAASNDTETQPSARAWDGLETISKEIEVLAGQVRRSLTSESVERPLRPPRKSLDRR